MIHNQRPEQRRECTSATIVVFMYFGICRQPFEIRGVPAGNVPTEVLLLSVSVQCSIIETMVEKKKQSQKRPNAIVPV